MPFVCYKLGPTNPLISTAKTSHILTFKAERVAHFKHTIQEPSENESKFEMQLECFMNERNL